MKSTLHKKVRRWLRTRRGRSCLATTLLVVVVGLFVSQLYLIRAHRQQQTIQPVGTVAPNHQKVTATMFWVGEPPDADNANITNVASAWTGDWVKAFGGVDSPGKRCGSNPCGFTPKENAFYFALPYNDFKADGSLKPTSQLQRIPWFSGPAPAGQSLLKNRWIAVTHNGLTAYAQWEDVGPMNEDDIDYVFGSKAPKFRAGLDLSPAMNDYLKLEGEGTVSWKFVESSSVPAGPWTATVTTSGIDYDD